MCFVCVCWQSIQRLSENVQFQGFLFPPIVQLGPAFAASRVQHLSDLHSKFTLGPHHVSKYVDIQPAAAEIRRGKKEDIDR